MSRDNSPRFQVPRLPLTPGVLVFLIAGGVFLGLLLWQGFMGWNLSRAWGNANSPAPVLAVRFHDLQGQLVTTPVFEVEDGWQFRYAASGNMILVKIIDQFGNVSEFLPSRDEGLKRMRKGGRFSIEIQATGDAEIAVFQDSTAMLHEIPEADWMDY